MIYNPTVIESVVLDSGRLNMISDLISPETKAHIQSKQGQPQGLFWTTAYRRDQHIVDRINMKLDIFFSILPKVSQFTKIKVLGNLPLLSFSSNDANQFQQLSW